jgi:hypothetical protein
MLSVHQHLSLTNRATMFVSTSSLYIEQFQYDEVTVANCVRYTEEFCRMGQRDPVLVEKQQNGLYKVLANHAPYLVAHILGLPNVRIQEYTPAGNIRQVSFPHILG